MRYLLQSRRLLVNYGAAVNRTIFTSAINMAPIKVLTANRYPSLRSSPLALLT